MRKRTRRTRRSFTQGLDLNLRGLSLGLSMDEIIADLTFRANPIPRLVDDSRRQSGSAA